MKNADLTESNPDVFLSQLRDVLSAHGLRIIKSSVSASFIDDQRFISNATFSIHFMDLNNAPAIDVEKIIEDTFPAFKCVMKDSVNMNSYKMTRIVDNDTSAHPMKNILSNIARLGNLDPKCDYSLMLKLMEEVGEFSECFNHLKGNLPHKTMKEKIEGEAADVIICAIAVIARVYPDLNPDSVIKLIMSQLALKSEKWNNVIDFHLADKRAEKECVISRMPVNKF